MISPRKRSSRTFNGAGPHHSIPPTWNRQGDTTHEPQLARFHIYTQINEHIQSPVVGGHSLTNPTQPSLPLPIPPNPNHRNKLKPSQHPRDLVHPGTSIHSLGLSTMHTTCITIIHTPWPRESLPFLSEYNNHSSITSYPATEPSGFSGRSPHSRQWDHTHRRIPRQSPGEQAYPPLAGREEEGRGGKRREWNSAGTGTGVGEPGSKRRERGVGGRVWRERVRREGVGGNRRAPRGSLREEGVLGRGDREEGAEWMLQRNDLRERAASGMRERKD
jgi:hypothetical protein